jgi:predicted phosphodiesterase
MKIAIASDLHLEFAPIVLKNTEGAKVLILSGDICLANRLKENDWNNILEGTHSDRYHKFFQDCCSKFEHVIYVAGNHEHYDYDFAQTVPTLKKNLEYLENLHVLENDTVDIEDFTFIGATLWTDMNNEDPLTMYHIKSMMMDFSCIKNSLRPLYRTVPLYKKGPDGKYLLDKNGNYIQEGTKEKEEVSKFSPEDAVTAHRKTMDYINAVVSNRDDHKFVVVGHHGPSFRSVHEMYAHDTLMNGGYHSELSDFIAYRPQIKLWTHGHTHEPFDYVISTTRVVCNPRGYKGHEKRAEEFELKYVDV